MLDAVDDSRPSVRLCSRTWLNRILYSRRSRVPSKSSPGISRLLEPLCLILLEAASPQSPTHHAAAAFRTPLKVENPSQMEVGTSVIRYDARQVLYCIRKIQSVASIDSAGFAKTSLRDRVSSDVVSLVSARLRTSVQSDDTPPLCYFEVLCFLLVRFFCLPAFTARSTDGSQLEFASQHASVRAAAAECLQLLIRALPPQLATLSRSVFLQILVKPVAIALQEATRQNDSVMQLQSLNLLRATLHAAKGLPSLAAVDATKNMPDPRSVTESEAEGVSAFVGSTTFTAMLLQGLRRACKFHTAWASVDELSGDPRGSISDHSRLSFDAPAVGGVCTVCFAFHERGFTKLRV